MAEIDLPALPEPALVDFLQAQRWFGAKGRDVVGASVLDVVTLAAGSERRAVALVEVRYAPGGHDIYQLLLGQRGDGEVRDAFADHGSVQLLMRLIDAGATACSEQGKVEFCPPDAETGPTEQSRALDVEQSNSSVVVDERLIVKLYRRLDAGPNPELELLRFLSAHGFANAPELVGWWGYAGVPLTATLGTVQGYLADATDGWSLALADIAERPDDFLARLPRMGEVVGRMHAVLASDPDDPAFAPEQASSETLALLRATVDDEIEQLFENLPDDGALAPIAHSGDAIRDLLGELASFGSVGRMIRHHGDLHLGQVLWTRDDWFVVDFEGEPARSLPERRLKRSPLRDVAGMLRSFDYAALAAGSDDERFQRDARELFLAGYRDAVDPAGILPGTRQIDRLIAMFELEKAVYELRYELTHRPDWVFIPVAGIERLLERASA